MLTFKTPYVFLSEENCLMTLALCCIKVIVRHSFQTHKYLFMCLYYRDSRFVILEDFNGRILL